MSKKIKKVNKAIAAKKGKSKGKPKVEEKVAAKKKC